MMINLSEPGSFILFSLAAILVSLAAVPISLTRSSAPVPMQTVRIRIRYLYRLSPVGVVGVLLVGAQQGAFWSLGPIFAGRIGFDTFEITLFMSAAVIGGALGQWPLGKLSDRIDRRKVLLGSCCTAAVIGLGTVVGAVLAWPLAGLIGPIFMGAAGVPFGVLMVCVGTLALAAFGATIVPARRAATVDPMRALRQE